MSGPIVRSGPNPAYSANWDQVFGSKKKAKTKAKSTTSSGTAKKTAKRKPAKKKA